MKQGLIFLFIAIGFLTASCQSNQDSGGEKPSDKVEASAASRFEILSPADFKAKLTMDHEYQLVDVRTPKEFSEGHIEGAVNINFFDADFQEQLLSKLDKEKPVLLYCRSGNRSGKTGIILQQSGFREVYDLKGGFPNWRE